MSAFLFIMVLNTLKFTIQKEKKRIFIFKYCKIDVKSAATLILAATLITAPTVESGSARIQMQFGPVRIRTGSGIFYL